MSLRVKLALALALLTTAATLAIGTWSYVGTSNRLYAEIDRSLQDSATAASHPDPDDRPGGNDKDHPRPYSAGQEQVLTQTLAADGTVVVASTGLELPVDDTDRGVAAASGSGSSTPTSVRRDIAIDGEPYRLLTTSDGDGLGAIQTARSLSEIERVLDSLRNLVLVAGLIVIVAAAATGWLIATQVTRRLVRLTRSAEEVAETGRLDVPVPVSGKDEAGRLGTAFNGMLAALRRSKDAQHRLVQDAGHELRTPLTSLRTNVSVLQRHAELPAATRAQVLSDLDAETRELSTLVDELVELATDQRADEPTEALDVAALAERVAERARRRTNRLISVTDDRSVTEIVGKPLALERALSNLLDNAAKFDLSDAPIELAILGKDGPPATVLLTVADRGPGIDPDDLPHVFDRFYRSVDARSRPGSGLGLAIVADIAEDHHGRAWAEARDGGGTRMTLELPVSAG